MQSLIANGEAAAHAQLHLEVIADAPDPAAPYPGQPLPPQIIGEKSGRIYFIDAHQVEYLASAGNYVVTHVGTQEFLTRATLKGILRDCCPWASCRSSARC
jgi:DNA-binding LytR/AlgR family response regulator